MCMPMRWWRYGQQVWRVLRWKCTPALNLHVDLLSDPNRFLVHALLLTTASVAMHLISQNRSVGSSAIVHKEIPCEKVAEHAGNIRLYELKVTADTLGGFQVSLASPHSSRCALFLWKSLAIDADTSVLEPWIRRWNRSWWTTRWHITMKDEILRKYLQQSVFLQFCTCPIYLGTSSSPRKYLELLLSGLAPNEWVLFASLCHVQTRKRLESMSDPGNQSIWKKNLRYESFPELFRNQKSRAMCSWIRWAFGS